MKTAARVLAALAAAAFLATAALPLLALIALLLLLADAVSLLPRRHRPEEAHEIFTDSVSVVIPTWNGKHHLRRNLPSVLAALEGHPDSEVLVIDNDSEDGSVEYLARQFPSVRVVETGANSGFAHAANLGFSIASRDIVVLLNNDMEVDPGFLQPLLDGFCDRRVFSVTAQIHFQNPSKPREETGLTTGRWHQGRVRIDHVADDSVRQLFPVFYSGGGSSAFDRLKVLELGGFDEAMSPFYMEDVDLSYMAWKRGWINLHAHRSVVRHLHRGTIGAYFTRPYINRVIQKNRLLFAWKNIHDWRRLPGHFAWLYADMWLALAGAADRCSSLAFLVAASQSLRIASHRVGARHLARIADDEALRRPKGGFFRDRFHLIAPKVAADLDVLFVSPYPIEPPTHGGAVFMKQAVRGLASRCRLHLLCLLERDAEREAHRELAAQCASAEFLVRRPSSPTGAPLLWPHAARTYWDPRLEWAVHRVILQRRIDVVQIEYAQLASYGASFRQIVTCLFEHDLHFQSVRRAMLSAGPSQVAGRAYEYLRALRFELRSIPRYDAVQVCSAPQARLLRSLLGGGTPVLHGLRAAIDVASYPFQEGGREPDTVLFVGNFRHPPNLDAIRHLLKRILPLVQAARPQVRLVVAGAEPPPALVAALERQGAECLGRVPEIRDLLGRYAVFAAPVLSGSGVRVKVLEAFAAGIPVVSTRLGAEGLCGPGSGLAEIADRPRDFAKAVVRLLEDRRWARAIARAARGAVERDWNGEFVAPRLAERYAALLDTKLLSRSAYPLPLQKPEARSG